MKSRTEIIKYLLDYRYRIFSTEEFTRIIKEIGYSEISVRQLIFALKKDEIIEPIKPGLYSLNVSFLSSPITSYEIASKAVKDSFLCYLSAISIHELTDQLPLITYICTGAKETKNQLFKVNNSTFKIIKIETDRIFGIEKKLYGETFINVTNLERTLIDAITRPSYCAGFREVIYYFEQAKLQLNVDVIIDYASKLGVFCLQRLGWIFDYINFQEAAEKVKQHCISKTYALLDSSGSRRGKYNKKWKIIENI